MYSEVLDSWMVKGFMEKEGKQKTGHSIRTYRVRLYDRHLNWIKETKELYLRVVHHFLQVLIQEEGMLGQSDYLLLRELEAICIGTKEMKAEGVAPKYPLKEFPKIPLYFRRSAINAAVDLARKGAINAEPNMVLYKGMYQNFTDGSVEIKLFNGEKWVWVTYPFTGRDFPKDAERLSPMLVLEKKAAWLEVPVSFAVSDVRTVKERMETEDHICALSFPDNDALAVAVILSKEAKMMGSRYFKGGKEKEEYRRRILHRIQASEESRHGEFKKVKEQNSMNQCEAQSKEHLPKENSHLYAELKNLNRHHAHDVSRKIVEFCLEEEIKVIVVPNYEKAIDFRDKKYLKTDAYRWLGRSIIKNLKYKAFQQGIVVTSIKPYHISDRCSVCGEAIAKYNEGHTAGKNYHGGKLFVCPNGHKGNTAENSARNIGKQFLSYYKES